ncbi:unnamed protein product [Owenia fusiformis]|uniref:Uncharacterized protein n=1 Tax=Owenia fusiformis TaxID=6347 RepID=A0A8J1XUW8_OWEFU|nr:unnamed protein product [Owenia fusiformis]
MTDGFGAITWWGFSEALDLQDKDINASFKKLDIEESKDELNILLIGAGDIRHILKTVARSYRWSKKKIHFYVAENNLELYARDLLMMTVALENQGRMGLQDKTELFLEIFGNSQIRYQTCEYVEKMTNEFIKMVTDDDYMEKKMPVFDMSLLKFKERDMLEGILKFWRNKDKTVFPIEKFWEYRLRQYLGQRYDAIPNVFDWDYSMKLLGKDVSIIRGSEYSSWRTNGVAFEIREGNYNQPNKTLASGLTLKKDGERILRRGYWGDIIVSPYISYGIDCEEKSFFKTQNKQHVKSAVDVSEYNILSMLYELQHKSRYIPPEPSEEKTDSGKQQATLTEITEEDEEIEASEESPLEKVNLLDKEYSAMALDDVKITFLPIGSIGDLHKKAKFQKLFNTIYFSNSMVHLLNQDLSAVFADKASLVLETSRFMLELTKEQSQEFLTKVTAMAQGIGCKVASDACDVEKDSFKWFTFTR